LALRGGASRAPGAAALRRAGALLGVPARWRRWWPWRPAPLPLLLADGRFAFIAPGGTGAPVLALEGPAVPALQRDFLDDWAQRLQPALAPRRFTALQPVAGQQQLVRVPPEHPLGAQALRAALLQAVTVAQSRIRLALGPGEKLGPALLRALCRAAWRGVDVELLLPRPVRATALLQRAGALCRVVPGAPSAAPALAVVDGLWAALGTPRLADEAAPVLLDVDAGADFERQFKRRFDAAARVQP
uniref:phospholipase D-like domain-containing protein n=1 Tax=Azohydromonas aeria TaxID=2590212 RepID=UPI0035BEE17D